MRQYLANYLVSSRLLRCFVSATAPMFPMHVTQFGWCFAIGLCSCPNVVMFLLFEDKKTPLHAACSTCDVAAAKLLITLNADINERENNHQTPLHISASKGDISMVRYLVNLGADVDLVGCVARTHGALCVLVAFSGTFV